MMMFLIFLTTSQFQVVHFVVKDLKYLGIVEFWHANMCIILGVQPHILVLLSNVCIRVVIKNCTSISGSYVGWNYLQQLKKDA
jgi:hypothetical protein